MNDFLNIVIVGAALSLAIEWITKKFGSSNPQAKAITIALCLVVGGAYWFLSALPVWQSILGVLGAASAVYAIFFNRPKVEAPQQ